MAWKQLTPPITLVQGKRYSALLHLSFIEKVAATPSIIQGKFAAVGFTNVSVDMSDASNPRCLGTWSGPDQDDVDFPDEVKTVWEWEDDVTTDTDPGPGPQM
jgi:hypothetical protein